jgi:hypothetical protein
MATASPSSAMTTVMDEPTLWLEGKWQGAGSVIKDGIPIVQYKEMSEFKVLKTAPATIVNVQQFTKHAESNAPLHAENGFLKIFPTTTTTEEGRRAVEASYSHPFGMNEFEFGELTASTLTLMASEEYHFQRPKVVAMDDAQKASQLTHVHRVYKLVKKDEINFTVHLGIGGAAPKLHLQGTLHRA